MVILISRNFWWKNKYLFLEIFNNYLGIIRFIRAILQYVENKLKAYNNDLTRCLFCVCKCCLWCLEKFMRFINRNAYIMCAIKSTNFCVSAKDAFSLLMRNIVRVLVLNNVSTLKPRYNEPRYSEFCNIVNKTQLPFWGFTKYITFDIVNYSI